MVKHHTKLTAQERDLIAIWKGGGVPLREIARRLGRSHSTIVYEIQKNSYKGKYYVAIHAQAKVNKRKLLARKRHPLKDAETYSYVIEKLKMGWSPEQIAGRLKKKNRKTVICHETIYRFIYSDHPEAQRLKLWEYLPRKQVKRKKRHGRKVKKILIPNRVSIHLRPARVDTRDEIGHWEGDSIEGKAHKSGIHIEAERLARSVTLIKLERINFQETINAQIKTFEVLPEHLRKSTTLDNGTENVNHETLYELGMKTFFADANAAWQKATVENTIGLVRRYLPKGTDFTDVTQEELDDIAYEINERPRKVLNYNTPNEVMRLYASGRIQTRM